MAQTGPLLEVSGSCHQSAAGLHSFLELGVFFQAHVVAGRVELLVVIGPKPAAPRAHVQFPAAWPST